MTCKNCSNVIIRGLTWNGCGDSKNIVNGAINLERIANLSIQDCIFQFSKSRALTIWTVSGLIELVARYPANIYTMQIMTPYIAILILVENTNVQQKTVVLLEEYGFKKV